MSYATCFTGTRGLPFFESGATAQASQVVSNSNGAGGLAGQCSVYSLAGVPSKGFNTLNKSRVTQIRLSIGIQAVATEFTIIQKGRLPPFVYDARLVCFSDADLVTYAGNLINCPTPQIITVLGVPRGAIALGNDGLNVDWTEVADDTEDPTVDFAVYSASVLIRPEDYNISGGLFIVMNARDGEAVDDELRSAFNIIPAKSSIDYVCI
jgi:hypothetical protein